MIDQLHINAMDATVLVILLVSGLFAIFRGLVAEILSLLAWVGAWVVVTKTAPLLLPMAEQHLRPETLADAVVYVLLFVLSLVAFGMLARFISSKVRGGALGALDRTLGAAFGLMRGAFVVCLAYLLTSMVMPRQDMPDWARKAKSLPAIERGTDLLKSYFPKGSLIHDSQTEISGRFRQIHDSLGD